MLSVGVLASDWLPQVQAMVLATALPWLEKHYLKPIWLRFYWCLSCPRKDSSRLPWVEKRLPVVLAVRTAFEKDQHDTGDLSLWALCVTGLVLVVGSFWLRLYLPYRWEDAG